MIAKRKLNKILDICMQKGSDFAEIYLEDSVSHQIELISDEIENITTNYVFGAGIRVIKDDVEFYGYTNDVSIPNLMMLINKLTAGIKIGQNKLSKKLKNKKIKNKHEVKILPSTVNNETKINYMKKVYQSSKNFNKEVSQVVVNLFDKEQKITIANSNGKLVRDNRTLLRMFCSVVASNKETMQTAVESIAAVSGYELFDKRDLKIFGEKVAKRAITILHADEMKGGVMDVVIHNAFGGVLLHEACVHSLEAELVAKKASVFSDMIGQKIASDIVTAIDDATIINEWGSSNIDDEGSITKRNILIENGILKSYLVDYKNSDKMNHDITSSARRASYKYLPTARMSNTFLMPGESTMEEIIAKTKSGLFAKSMGGGSVDPSTGEFNFSVSEGYIIENGKITKPVRGATLVGSGKDVLLNIDMIANNLEFGYGMCGASSGNIPVCVGQPTIRVKKMTVGGRGS